MDRLSSDLNPDLTRLLSERAAEPGDYIKLHGPAYEKEGTEGKSLSVEQKAVLHEKHSARVNRYLSLANTEQDRRDAVIHKMAAELESQDYSAGKELISILDDISALNPFLKQIGETPDWSLNNPDDFFQEKLDPVSGDQTARNYIEKCLEGIFNVELRKGDMATAFKILDLFREYGLEEPKKASLVDSYVDARIAA